MNSRQVQSLTLLTLLVVTSGCGYSRWARGVGAFSLPAPAALAQVDSAYLGVSTIHTLEEESTLIDHYSSTGYRPGQLTDFIKQDDLRAREAAISVLRDYAIMVSDLALGKRELAAKTKSLTSTTAAGVRTAMATTASTNTTTNTTTATNTTSNAVKVNTTLTDTTTNAGSSTKTGSVTSTLTSSRNTLMTQQQMNMVISGMDAAIKPFIHHMVKKRLRPLMKAADPTIQQLCVLLSEDLVTLRSQAKSDYLVLLMGQSEFIQRNMYKFSPLELRAETKKLYQIERDAAKADSDLTNASDAVKRLAETHHQLVTGERHGAK